jgi:hypothetical protein
MYCEFESHRLRRRLFVLLIFINETNFNMDEIRKFINKIRRINENLLIEDMQYEKMLTKDVNKFPKGPIYHNRYSPEYFDYLKNEIKRDGEIKDPIELEYYVKDNAIRVKNGHHRLYIAIELGIKIVPVIVNVIWGYNIFDDDRNIDIRNQELYHPPKKLDVEYYKKINYAPTNIKLSEIGLNNVI